MAWFTKQEKHVIIFILLAIVLGEGLWLHNKHIRNQKPEYRGQIREYSDKKVDINKASQEELVSLPQVGPALANRIIEHRQSCGMFLFIEDIKKVKGIGEMKFQKVKERIRVE